MTGENLAALALAVVSAAGLSGCGGSAVSSPPPNLRPQSLTIVTREYAVSTGGVRALRPGLVTIDFKSEGATPHALGVWRLRNGVSYRRFLRDAGRQDASALVTKVGGIPYLGPGSEWRMTTRLRKGVYLLLDYESSTGRRLNWQRGAIARLFVRGRYHDALPPSYDYTIAMRGHSFVMQQPQQTSKDSVFKITNESNRVHDVRLLKLSKGMSVRSGLKAVRAYLAGKASSVPGEPNNLLGLVAPGWTGYVQAALDPGRYLVLGFARDPKNGKTDTELGMASTLELR